MASNQELPQYTQYTATRPLPDAVAALARQLGRDTVRAHGAGDYPLPGRAFEAIADAPQQQADTQLRHLAVQAGQWLEHPQFPSQFARGYWEQAQAQSDDEQTPPAVDALSGVIGAHMHSGPRYPIPRVITASTITDMLAGTLAETYGRHLPDDTDLAAARSVQAHVVAVLEHLSTDSRVRLAASTTGAVLKAARVLDRDKAIYQTMTGDLSTG